MIRTVDPSKYTLTRVQQVLGLSRAVLSSLIAEGVVIPARGARNELLFSFQDLTLLRTAHRLREANISPLKISRSLAKLRAELPSELPLTGLRVTAIGSDVVVRDRARQWQAESGQLLIDFDIAPSPCGSITFMQHDETSATLTAEECFAEGVDLEEADSAAAERAYRQAIELDPGCADAYVNLGAMLCKADRSKEAVMLYSQAIVHHPRHALLHFNRAVAFEDQDLPAEALAAYLQALVVDPGLADAHFNAARLYQHAGDFQGTLRHFNAYRRLQAKLRS